MKKRVVNRAYLVYNIYRWRAKKCEVAETPINVVMAVIQGIRMEQSIIEIGERRKFTWQTTKLELD